MSPTPTPTPPYPPLDLTHVDPVPGDRLASVIAHANDHPTANLDALLASTDSGIGFPLPFAPAITVTFSATPMTAGAALLALLTTALGVLAIYAFTRVTSPEAQARRADKRAVLHARYSEHLHAEREARRAAHASRASVAVPEDSDADTEESRP
ncbi:hypothetical protein MMAG44476_14305 [Mycolicibacterium mageritense DSM 44476 = CIP 104973]|uniref:DUF3040 domain-containing protein n=1 Tax=Mycolicibacterium mageritense TaxID=53462 RepID=A0ABM7HSU3_MYCME|nr:hypothetical protein [Mycolicibacterium mageritense]BBX33629.1 hypothetical protein MMAGJ_29110 [Mycolicibacterium mageritense]CDO22057.1 hypothetical protein BN978_02522 [Mycolicibacterium mageritense DSM 44476 = CIP 104973]